MLLTDEQLAKECNKLKNYTNLKDQQLSERIGSLHITMQRFLELKHLDQLMTVVQCHYDISIKAFKNWKMSTPNLEKARTAFYVLAMQVKGGESLQNIANYLGFENASVITKKVTKALKYSPSIENDLSIIKEKYSLL